MKPFRLIILFALLTSFFTLFGCLESNIQTPPFSTSQFVSRATDLNYANWKNSDYNNMVLVFKNDKISVADANDLNVALPNLTEYVDWVDGNSTYAFKTDVNTWGDERYIQGSGSSGQISYWSGEKTQTGTNDLNWDATNQRLNVRMFDAGILGTQTANISGNINIIPVQNPKTDITLTEELGAGYNLLAGTYCYSVIYVSSTGGSTEGGYGNTNNCNCITTTGTGRILLSDIPVSTDERVLTKYIMRTKRNVYTSCTSDYRVVTLNNAVTTYTDNVADASLPTGINSYRKSNDTVKGIYLNNSLFLTMLSWNTGFGSTALESLTTGFENTAFGLNVLGDLTTGSSNTCMGSQACLSLTTGGSNTAVGASSVGYQKTGTGNVGVGNFTLRTLSGTQEVNYNTAVGYSALGVQLLTGDNYNSAFGANAGKYVNGGHENVLLGANVINGGDTVTRTIGSHNVFTGFGVAQANFDVSNNIVLGYDIDPPFAGSSGGDNRMSIGNVIYGNGINATGTNIDYDANIGIRNNNPQQALDVNGFLKVDKNIILTSPNGSKWNCGVDNSGVFSCS